MNQLTLMIITLVLAPLLVWGRSVSHINHKQFSETPAGRPTIQLNFDTIFPEIASDFTG